MTIGTRNLGTAANNSLVAIQYTKTSDGLQAQVFANLLTPAAIAAINAMIKYDTPASLAPGESFDPNTQLQPTFNHIGRGQIVIPSRGVLRLFEGDVVAVDPQTGWPIVLSPTAANSNPAWVLSAVNG